MTPHKELTRKSSLGRRRPYQHRLIKGRVEGGGSEHQAQQGTEVAVNRSREETVAKGGTGFGAVGGPSCVHIVSELHLEQILSRARDI